jgi:UDP-N-acetylglucosamine acyltransferase
VATGAATMKAIKPFSRYIPGKPISVNYYAITKYLFVEFTKEIEDYVLRNIKPTSSKIHGIVSSFEKLVQDKGFKEY